MEQTMKSYLFRLLNHEELTLEEMKTYLPADEGSNR